MNAVIFLILLPYIEFVRTQNVLFNSGFKYLTETLHQIPTSADLNRIKTRWILQNVDHFDKESVVWKMRYFENLIFFKHQGPVYIFLGGESEASPRYLSTGIIYDLAQETNGAMFLTEHRYYGKSLPFNDVFQNVEHMKWLTSRQALADIAHLIKHIKASPIFKFSKVVVIGGSYAGNLAAWMRLLYPDLVDAAIASSGPVLAKKDFFEYLEKVSDDYECYGTAGCSDMIKDNFETYEEMLQTSEGIDELKNKFNICNECNMSVVENQWVFYSSIMDLYMGNAQYGNPELINNHCSMLEQTITNNKLKPMLFNANNNCFDYTYENMLKEMRTSQQVYSWYYQTCTEFGYYQTTDSDSQLFGKVLPLEFFTKICEGTYGPDFNEDRVDKGVEITNKMYGGLEPNITHVVFTNGDMDPWSTLGILEDLSYDAPSIVIHRASHCTDLFPERKGATEEIKEAAKYVKHLIKSWIGTDKEV